MIRLAGIGAPLAHVHALHRRSGSNHVLAVRIYSSPEAAARGLAYLGGPRICARRTSRRGNFPKLILGAAARRPAFIICARRVIG